MSPRHGTATPSTWMPTTRSHSGVSSKRWERNKIIAVSLGCSISLLLFLAAVIFYFSRRRACRTNIKPREKGEVKDITHKRTPDLDDGDGPCRLYPEVENITNRQTPNLEDEAWSTRVYVEQCPQDISFGSSISYPRGFPEFSYVKQCVQPGLGMNQRSERIVNRTSERTINPWLAEHNPNPVMFPHLHSYPNVVPTVMPSRPTTMWTLPTPPHVEENSDVADIGTRDKSKSPSLDLERDLPETTPDSLTFPIPQEFFSGLASESNAILSVTPGIASSLTKPMSEQSRQLSSNSEILEPTSSDSTVCSTTETLSLSSADNVEKATNSKETCKQNLHPNDHTDGNRLYLATLGYDLEVERSSMPYHPLLHTESHAGTPHTCVPCTRHFRTAGQLNSHTNRRHRRRYACEHCSSAFALKADLQRHILSVHRDTYQQEARVWRCSNTGCNVPNKEFRRKDNFVRHVSRCSRKIEARQKEYTIE